jgi:hypothetical protein
MRLRKAIYTHPFSLPPFQSYFLGRNMKFSFALATAAASVSMAVATNTTAEVKWDTYGVPHIFSDTEVTTPPPHLPLSPPSLIFLSLPPSPP